MIRHVRLSRTDAGCLTEKQPLAMSLCIAGPSTTSGALPTVEDFRAMAASRLDLSPRYRQRILAVPALPGFRTAPAAPVWVDDTNFDLDRHIVTAGPPHEISIAEALEIAAGLIDTEHFDLDHPPWRLHLIERIEGNRFGLVSTMHHAAADGMASLAFLTVLVANWEPDLSPPETPTTWQPEPPPTKRALQAEAVRDRAADLGRRIRTLGRRNGPSKAWALARVPGVFRRLRGHAPVLAYAANLDDPLRLHVWDQPLPPLRDAAKILADSATFNDIVLAALSGGIRAWQQHRCLPVADTRVLLPVNVADRTQADAGAPSNHVADLFSVLPVSAEDPHARLETVHSRTATSKTRRDTEPLTAFGLVAGRLPTRLRRRVSRFIWDRYVCHTIMVSNFPGPPVPFYLLDCPVEALYPLGTVGSRGVVLWVTSVAGQAHFSLVTDPGIPDSDQLADAIGDRLDEYVTLAARHTAIRAVPGLASLPEDTLAELADALEPTYIQSGKAVFHEGDAADTFYLVRHGTLDVTSADHEHLRSLGPGDSFGEVALVNDSPRTATVTATTDTELWALEREHFLTAIEASPTARILTRAVIDTHLANTR